MCLSGQSWTRTNEGLRQWVYSPPQLPLCDLPKVESIRIELMLLGLQPSALPAELTFHIKLEEGASLQLSL